MNEYTAYCLACRSIRSIIEPSLVLTTHGRKLVKGKCSKCGKTINKIVGIEPLNEEFEAREMKEKQKKEQQEKQSLEDNAKKPSQNKKWQPLT